MDFSLPRLYVAKSTNTLPTTGTTATLAADQVGIFLPSYAPATAANAGAADYIFIASGRPAVMAPLNLGSNKGEWISKSNVISKNIIKGTAASAVQISTITSFTAQAGNQYSITIRAFSEMLDTSSRRGWEEIFTVNGPCLNCGADPCAALTAQQTSDLVDAFLAQMNARKSLKGYLTFAKTGSGATSGITVTGVAQTQLPTNCNVWVNRYKLDAVTFDIFAQVDPPTMQDYAIPSPCNTFATITVTQTPTFARGTAGEVRDKELEYYSYAVPKFKELFADSLFNGIYTSEAEAGVVYDMFVIRALNYEKGPNYSDVVKQEFTNILYCANTKTTAIQAILEAALGTFHDVTPQ